MSNSLHMPARIQARVDAKARELEAALKTAAEPERILKTSDERDVVAATAAADQTEIASVIVVDEPTPPTLPTEVDLQAQITAFQAREVDLQAQVTSLLDQLTVKATQYDDARLATQAARELAHIAETKLAQLSKASIWEVTVGDGAANRVMVAASSAQEAIAKVTAAHGKPEITAVKTTGIKLMI